MTAAEALARAFRIPQVVASMPETCGTDRVLKVVESARVANLAPQYEVIAIRVGTSAMTIDIRV